MGDRVMMINNVRLYVFVVFCVLFLSSCCCECDEDEETKKYYQIGDIGPAGGYIFYNKGFHSDGWRYLEAAPARFDFNAEWGAYGSVVLGTYTGVGTGRQNTQVIIDKCSELGELSKAAHWCDRIKINGFDDWFLPSKDELYFMYQNLRQDGLGDFPVAWYWSSTQFDDSSTSAWGHYFSTGIQGHSGSKNSLFRVRAVRAF